MFALLILFAVAGAVVVMAGLFIITGAVAIGLAVVLAVLRWALWLVLGRPAPQRPPPPGGPQAALELEDRA